MADRTNHQSTVERPRDSRAHERQHLPLRRLPQHRRSCPGRRPGSTHMNPFHYQRATAPDDAIHAIATTRGAKFLAGGTNLIDLMKSDVEHPTMLVDVSRLN